MMSNSRPSPMSVLSVESKQFPIFQPDLDWETTANNNPFSLLTTTPLNSAPVSPTHFLPYPLVVPYTNADYNTFSYPQTDSPANFCTFIKPEPGATSIDNHYDHPAFLGHPVCGNISPASIDFGLNLGHRTYFSSYDAAMINRLCRRSHGGHAQPTPSCQAQGCEVDLSNAKNYYRRHKVCEFHSKATIVVIGGMEKRFCQQCSRFHVVAEFDEVKRSCRKRLADHNRRRRKTHSADAGDGSSGNGSETARCIMKTQYSGRYSKEALNDSFSSEATTEQTKPALFPWIIESKCAALNVSGHHQSPRCAPSPNNRGPDESSRGSVSCKRQNHTEELQTHGSVFVVDQM